MIKGVNKQIVVVSCESEIFEQAIFVLKPQKYLNGKNIADEAQKIIDDKTSAFRVSKKSGKYGKSKINGVISKLFEE